MPHRVDAPVNPVQQVGIRPFGGYLPRNSLVT
jgi:hypothetical protein